MADQHSVSDAPPASTSGPGCAVTERTPEIRIQDAPSETSWIDVGAFLSHHPIDSLAERTRLVRHGACRFIDDSGFGTLVMPTARFFEWVTEYHMVLFERVAAVSSARAPELA